MEKNVLEQGIIRLCEASEVCASIDFTEDFEVIIRDSSDGEVFLNLEQWKKLKQANFSPTESEVRYFETWDGWDVTIDFTHPNIVSIEDYFDEVAVLTRKEWEQLKVLFF